MANTIMSAKNTFAEGLIMDFAPDNTQATCLTSALNATLLTFNGNEMSLQNDMGNGRVETARLPDGYIPVGTCEFGDIIYIVSYNPLTNKSQIGCFPSPERNISSEELGGLHQIISWRDFQESDNTGEPTGKIKSTSVKKIIFDKPLNPGDKYFIYTDEQGALNTNKDCITDYGNSLHLYGDYPKLLKLHVVAIEDTGKINYLDTSVKWYENGDYFLQEVVNKNTDGKPDIDSYRNAISDAYSIFQSKISGKLAILAELEKINGFSCSHSVATVGKGDNKKYVVYLHTSWKTDDMDVNPSGYKILTSEFKNSSASLTYLNKSLIEEDPFKDIYSRHYELENSNNYQDYIKSLSYNAIKENFISSFSKDNDKNYIPYKITQYKEEGLYTNTFIYNALEQDINGNYYFNDNTGQPVIVYKTSNVGSQENTKYQYNSVQQKYETDTFKHNYFNIDIVKKFFEIDAKDVSGVYNYTVCPTMPYGYLDEYSINNFIDFDKIGSGIINLNEWRYYNDAEVSTLTFGLETYPEDGKGIKMIELEFYDNQGLVGNMQIKDRTSYSGSFTEIIQLDSDQSLIANPQGHPGVLLEIDKVDLSYRDSNDNLLKKKITPKEIINADINSDDIWKESINSDLYNLALMWRYNTVLIRYEGNSTITTETGIIQPGTIIKPGMSVRNINDDDLKVYQSDAGILYSNHLYLVKVIVHEQYYNSLGEFDKREADRKEVFSRWYWTNNMWNDQYYNKKDYNTLKPSVSIQVNGQFLETSDLRVNNEEVANLVFDPSSEMPPQQQTLGYHKYSITSENGNPNLKLILTPQLANDYNTFMLHPKGLDDLRYKIYEGNTKITFPETIEKIMPKDTTYIENIDLLNPIVNKQDGIVDKFTLESQEQESDLENIYYSDVTGEQLNTEGFKKYIKNASDFIQVNDENIIINDGILLSMEGQFHSKIMGAGTINKNVECPVYSPILGDIKDIEKQGLINTAVRNEVYYIAFKNIFNIYVKNYGQGSVILAEQIGDSIKYMGSLSDGNELPKNSKINISTLINKYIDTTFSGNFLPIIYFNNNRKTGFNTHVYLNNGVRTTPDKQWSDLHGNQFGDEKQWLSWANTDYTNETVNEGTAVIHDDDRIDNIIMQIAVKSRGNLWVPLNVFVRLNAFPKSEGKLTQQFGKITNNGNTNQENSVTINGFKSFAEILAALLSQVYIKTDITQSKEVTIIRDIVINNSYQEKWNKDFVVNPTLKDINSLLALKGISFDDYKKQISTYCTDNNFTNIDFSFNNTASLIRFEHVCNYNIDSILNKYSSAFNETSSNSVYMTKSIGYDIEGFQDKSVVNNGVSYLNLTKDGSKVKGQYSADSTGILLRPLNVDGERDLSGISGVKISDFMQILRVVDNNLVLNKSEQNLTCSICMESADDGNEVTQFRFDKTLQVNDNFTIIK